MHALYLPGNDPANREVAHELAGMVSGATPTVIEYPHWQSDEPGKEIVDVAETSRNVAESFSNVGLVVAKSMGVLIALRAQFESDSFDPDQVVFIGAPFKYLREHHDIDEWLKGFKTPSLWIQQDQDPLMPAEELQEYLSIIGIAEVNFVSLEGNTHDYEPGAVAEIINDRLPVIQKS
jgi:pimeloyl-ACP methyl ester carboxylesterase